MKGVRSLGRRRRLCKFSTPPIFTHATHQFEYWHYIAYSATLQLDGENCNYLKDSIFIFNREPRQQLHIGHLRLKTRRNCPSVTTTSQLPCTRPGNITMSSINDIDAHEQPSDEMRAKWKSWSRMDAKELKANEAQLDDPRRPPEEAGFLQSGFISKDQRKEAFTTLDPAFAEEATDDVPLLYHPLLPGK